MISEYQEGTEGLPSEVKDKYNPKKSSSKGLALTIGTFDGVHIGHQLLLRATSDIAESRELESSAYTYELPPKRYLGEQGPPLLMEPRRKIDLLGDYVQRVVLGNFLEVKDLTPEQFVERVLVNELNVKAVVVGDDWRFGRNRTGSYRDLEDLSRGRFTVHPKKQLKKRGRSVSSTWVRQLLSEGNIALVTELLDRYPVFSGEVVKGDQIGSDIGFPTANVDIDDRVALPRRGSYAALAKFDDRHLKSAVHVGSRPTFDDNDDHRLEVHLFDFEGELYGKRLEVEFVKYLGGSKKYGANQKLRKAISDYVAEARRVLNEVS